MTNREYVIGYIHKLLEDGEDAKLVSMYQSGVGHYGEIESVCESCRKKNGRCTIAHYGKQCGMTETEWANIEAVFKTR